VIDTYKIGLVMNAAWDSKAAKLRAEAWIEVDRANKVDPRIMQAVENNQPMELSTGLFSDHEDVPGVWNGEEYAAIARNYRPDHLALLPDIKGACSMADGAGFLVCNALSHEDTRASLYTGLRERLGDVDFWIADVFAASVVYEHGSKLWKLMYTAANDVATLIEGDPVQVHRNVQYRTVDGVLVGNVDFPLTERTQGGVEMSVTRKEAVDRLIANEATNWTAEDRDGLMGMNEAQLEKMLPPEPDTQTAPEGNIETPEQAVLRKGAAANALAVENAAKAGAAGVAPATLEAQPITLEQMTPEMQSVYRHGLATLQAERLALTTKIVAVEGNTFTPEALAACSIEQLQGMANLCASATPATPQAQAPVPVFGGAAAPVAPVANATPVEHTPLGLPTMNFAGEDNPNVKSEEQD
jgi:hypothetical protein